MFVGVLMEFNKIPNSFMFQISHLLFSKVFVGFLYVLFRKAPLFFNGLIITMGGSSHGIRKDLGSLKGCL